MGSDACLRSCFCSPAQPLTALCQNPATMLLFEGVRFYVLSFMFYVLGFKLLKNP